MSLLLIILYIITILLMLSTAILTLLDHKNSKANIAYVLFCVSTTLWTIFIYYNFSVSPENYDLLDIMMRLAFAFSQPVMLFLILFFNYFHTEQFPFAKLLKPILVSFTLILMYLTLFTDQITSGPIIENGQYIADNLGPLYFVYSLYFLAYLIMAIVVGWHKILKTSGLTRKRVLVSYIGLLIFVISAVSTNVILPMFVDMDISTVQTIAPLFTMAFILLTFYAVQKYRFLSLSTASLRFSRNLIMVSISIIIVIIIDNYFRELLMMDYGLILTIIITLLAIFCFLFIQKIFPGMETAKYKVFKTVIKELRLSSYYCKTYDEFRKVLDDTFLLKLNFSKLDVFIIRDEGDSKKDNIPIYIRDKYIEKITEFLPDILIYDELKMMRDLKSKIYIEFLEKIDAKLCIPLYSGKKLIGLINIGKKLDDRQLLGEEIEEINKVKTFLEISFMNILLTDNLQVENDMMKEVVKSKTAYLKQKNNEINKLLTQQKDFIAVTAHEFRTPLSIALFQLEDTLQSHDCSVDISDEMKIVQSSLNDLKDLTQKLFDVEQYDLDKVNLVLNKVKLQDLIKKIHNDFCPIAKDQNIDLKLNIIEKKNIFMNIDEARIRQVFHNLLANALKFTPENGKILIEISSDNNKSNIYFSDSGDGILKKDKYRIFDKFQTINPTKGRGLGLGLYLCNKIVELHSGDLWVDDSIYGGAKFCVVIPNNL